MTELFHIEKLSCVCLIPRDHPAPESVRSRVDLAARERLPEACRRIAAALTRADDPTVWVIDRIRIEVAFDATMVGQPEASSLWASRIATGVARVMSGGPDETGGVRRFPGRAEYLAWLLGDIVLGRPWTTLHMREFEGLRAMPAPWLLLEAVGREEEIAERILLSLVRALGPGPFTSSLNEAVAARLLQVCAPDTDASGLDRDLWSVAIAAGRRASSPLGVYLRLREENPEVSREVARAAAELVFAVREALTDVHVASALARGEFSRTLKLSRSPADIQALLTLHTLAAGDHAWLKESASSLSPQASIEPEDSFESEFGGLLMLLPDLLEIWPESEPLFRYMVLLNCVGEKLAPLVWRDPVLLFASGLDELPAPEVLAQHQDLEAAAMLMRRFAQRLMGLERSSPEYLFRNVVAGAAMVVKQPGRVLVTLRPRPLQILMRMAGINGLSCRPPWMPDTEMTIELADE